VRMIDQEQIEMALDLREPAVGSESREVQHGRCFCVRAPEQVPLPRSGGQSV
jgi:hypothetical protein